MKKRKLVIVFGADAPYGEVVDSIADALEAGIIVEAQLEDGFQFQDLLSAVQVSPIVSEIVNDAPVFVEQFVQLNPNTAKAAILEARARIVNGGKKLGKVTNFIIRGLWALANSYEYALSTYVGAQSQFLMYQSLVKGGAVFPDEMMPTPIEAGEQV